MNKRLVTAFSPRDIAGGSPARAVRVSVPTVSAEDSVYRTVELFAEHLAKATTTDMDCAASAGSLPLRAVVNLHNADGIRELSQVAQMAVKIGAGHEIYHSSGLPNVTLVASPAGTKVLFDGHHTMLAYMCCGRECLDEIPYLMVDGEDGAVGARDMLTFFGAHAADIRPEDWSRLVINWQAPLDRQVCPRIQKDMGELFDALYGQQPGSEQ